MKHRHERADFPRVSLSPSRDVNETKKISILSGEIFENGIVY